MQGRKHTEAQPNMNDNQTLDARQQGIVTTSALTAKGDLENLRTALNRGLDAGLTVNEQINSRIGTLRGGVFYCRLVQ
jgi:hypothetical protein